MNFKFVKLKYLFIADQNNVIFQFQDTQGISISMLVLLKFVYFFLLFFYGTALFMSKQWKIRFLFTQTKIYNESNLFYFVIFSSGFPFHILCERKE